MTVEVVGLREQLQAEQGEVLAELQELETNWKGRVQQQSDAIGKLDARTDAALAQATRVCDEAGAAVAQVSEKFAQCERVLAQAATDRKVVAQQVVAAETARRELETSVADKLSAFQARGDRLETHAKGVRKQVDALQVEVREGAAKLRGLESMRGELDDARKGTADVQRNCASVLAGRAPRV